MHAVLQLPLQYIALVQEQHNRRPREQLARDDRLPQDERVFQAVDAGVLQESLVEAGYRGEEYDRVDVLEVRQPGVALAESLSMSANERRKGDVLLCGRRRRRR